MNLSRKHQLTPIKNAHSLGVSGISGSAFLVGPPKRKTVAPSACHPACGRKLIPSEGRKKPRYSAVIGFLPASECFVLNGFERRGLLFPTSAQRRLLNPKP